MQHSSLTSSSSTSSSSSSVSRQDSPLHLLLPSLASESAPPSTVADDAPVSPIIPAGLIRWRLQHQAAATSPRHSSLLLPVNEQEKDDASSSSVTTPLHLAEPESLPVVTCWADDGEHTQCAAVAAEHTLEKPGDTEPISVQDIDEELEVATTGSFFDIDTKACVVVHAPTSAAATAELDPSSRVLSRWRQRHQIRQNSVVVEPPPPTGKLFSRWSQPEQVIESRPSLKSSKKPSPPMPSPSQVDAVSTAPVLLPQNDVGDEM